MESDFWPFGNPKSESEFTAVGIILLREGQQFSDFHGVRSAFSKYCLALYRLACS